MTMTEALSTTAETAAVRGTDLKLLAVGENSGVLRNLARMAEGHGATLQPLPDASSALRSLAQAKWDLLIVVLDDDEEQQLTWWVDVLRPAPRRPRLVALVPSPSIGFAMRAA